MTHLLTLKLEGPRSAPLIMSPKTILIIEDEIDILEVLEHNLRREGFRVLSTRNGEEGLRQARQSAPDLILLDLMLPGLSGLEVCRLLRKDVHTSHIPIIMVTARGEESDVVRGLGLGADDYLPKPFGLRELQARVKAVMRRGPPRTEVPASGRISRGGLVVDSTRHEVRVNGRVVEFTATEFRLLHFLASHPGQAFTRAHLLSRIVGEDAAVLDRNIDVHIRAVRAKLSTRRDLIETVRGIGYRFRDREGVR